MLIPDLYLHSIARIRYYYEVAISPSYYDVRMKANRGDTVRNDEMKFWLSAFAWGRSEAEAPCLDGFENGV